MDGGFLENRKLAEFKACAHLASASAEGSLERGIVGVSGKVGAFVGAETTLAAGISGEDVKPRADTVAEGLMGAKASAEGRGELEFVGGRAKVEVFGGASAHARLSAGVTGVNAGVGAFAARARVPRPAATSAVSVPA